MANALSATDHMIDILSRYPGAKRALFSEYHIGGCSSCAYRNDESLAEVCARNEISVDEAIETILTSHEADAAFLIEPKELAQILTTGGATLLDCRTREEHEAVAIPGATLCTQEIQQQIFAAKPGNMIVLYDHTGRSVLDTCSWFAGHGIKNVRALRGGIDAWSQEVDSSVPRYRLELE